MEHSCRATATSLSTGYPRKTIQTCHWSFTRPGEINPNLKFGHVLHEFHRGSIHFTSVETYPGLVIVLLDNSVLGRVAFGFEGVALLTHGMFLGIVGSDAEHMCGIRAMYQGVCICVCVGKLQGLSINVHRTDFVLV